MIEIICKIAFVGDSPTIGAKSLGIKSAGMGMIEPESHK
jgi:hypothetical protein